MLLHDSIVGQENLLVKRRTEVEPWAGFAEGERACFQLPRIRVQIGEAEDLGDRLPVDEQILGAR